MITIRGQILVSRTNDDPLHPVCMYNTPSVCRFKTSPCVPAPRAHVEHMCAWCRHTRGRFECTHGGVFESTHDFFHIFSACFNTHKQTQTHTTTTTTHTTQHHNTQHHTETETARDRRQKQKETEKEDRKRETEKE